LHSEQKANQAQWHALAIKALERQYEDKSSNREASQALDFLKAIVPATGNS
jgi:hypothetical protein